MEQDDRAGRHRALAVLAAGGGGLGIWAVLAPRTELSVHLQSGWTTAVALVPAVLTVAVLARHLPRHGVTRVLTVMVLANVLALAGGVAVEHGTGIVALDDGLGWIAGAVWPLTLPLIPVLILLFPTGRPPSSRWRTVLRIQLVAIAALLVLSAVTTGDPEGATSVAAMACGGVLLASAAAAVLRLALGFRSLPDDDRARSRLFIVLACVLVAAYVLSPLVQPRSGPLAEGLLYALLVGGLPGVVGLSVLRYRLFGLELFLHRTLLGLAAGAALLATYLLGAYAVAGMGGPQVGEPSSVLLPALLVVAVLAPVTQAARRLVDRLLHGDRSRPHDALRRLGDSLAAAVAPAQAPQLVADALVQSLRVPWARVDLEEEGRQRTVAVAGARGAGTLVSVPLVRGGDLIGALVVEARPGQSRLASADHALLSGVAAQAAVGLEAAQLSAQLLDSRERLVLGREQERARLRRDLHDGLSPALAGMVLALEAGRRVLRTDPETSDLLLARVAAEARSCGDVVTRLLADLRPPGLAELGLLASVEDLAARLHRPGEFDVAVEASDPLPAVSPAVEVAAYRIVGEAVANAARHAAARHCTLRMRGVDELVVEVQDDGHGLDRPGTAVAGTGLGIPSMRERARDVGGTLELSSGAQGTTVRVRLPALTLRVPA